MNLTVSQLIAHATHALDTDQPNLAVLYMTKALTLLQQAREQAATRAALAAMVPVFDTVWEAIQGIWNALAGVAERVVQQFARPLEGIAEATTAGQADFALAVD